MRGVSAADLIGSLVDRAEDDDLFARHASAYQDLSADNPDLLREIELEDSEWEQSSLANPVTAD